MSKRADDYSLLVENLSKEKINRSSRIVVHEWITKLKYRKVIFEKTALEEEDEKKEEEKTLKEERKIRRRGIMRSM